MSSLVSAYCNFVRQHAGAVRAAEALLHNVTWLLPDRFSTSEVPLEIVNSVVGLLGVIHEHILQRRASGNGIPWPLLVSCIQQVR